MLEAASLFGDQKSLTLVARIALWFLYPRHTGTPHTHLATSHYIFWRQLLFFSYGRNGEMIYLFNFLQIQEIEVIQPAWGMTKSG